MRVLIVEDEALVALDLADMVRDLGHSVVGPFATVQASLPDCRDGSPDFAILDFNLGRGTSAELAELLAETGVPFAFLTGYRRDALPERFRDRLVLSKPCSAQALRQ